MQTRKDRVLMNARHFQMKEKYKLQVVSGLGSFGGRVWEGARSSALKGRGKMIGSEGLDHGRKPPSCKRRERKFRGKQKKRAEGLPERDHRITDGPAGRKQNRSGRAGLWEL